MALTRWILALCGYARLEVCGVHPERVLNACAAAGIACTASEPVDAYTLRITVRARCAETAAELARRCQCEVKTLYRRGLPQLLRRAVKGAILFHKREWPPLNPPRERLLIGSLGLE